MRTPTLYPGVAASAMIALAAIVMLAITDLSPAWRGAEWRPAAARPASAAHTDASTAPALSLRELYLPIETADGTVTSLAATNGHVRVAALFYTHCPLMCPLTVASIRALEAELTRGQRARLNVVLLSLDPVRDSAAALAGLRDEQGLDRGRWLLGRTAPEALPRLAAAFGVSVSRTAQGGIDHSPAVLLLDARGAVLARTTTVTGEDREFAAAVRAALGGARS